MSQQINLFNPIFLKQRKHFSLVTMLQALGLIVLGALFFYGYALFQVSQLKAQSEESTRRFNAEQARLARYAAEYSPQLAMQGLQTEVQRLESDLVEQTRMVETLKSGSIGNTTGYSQYMSAFSRQVVHGLWLTGFRVTGDAAQISLSGAVLEPELLPLYIRRLGKEPAMRGKSFSTLQMQQPKVDPGKDKQPAARYVEFTMYSLPESEGKK
ncbi:MAG: PilN domain-containing protein [Gallionella sp.]